MIEFKKELEKLARNSISVQISGKADGRVGESRFGGAPDVPKHFKWESYKGFGMYDDVKKSRPLAFLAQINLADAAKFDSEGLLPKTGLLSFFYEIESNCWGYDPKDKGCARVYYFEDISKLSPAKFPKDLSEEYRFPAYKFLFKSELSYPCFEDFLTYHPNADKMWDEFSKAQQSLKIPDEIAENEHRMLGFADVIQGKMTSECELISRGYYLGNSEGYAKITPQDRQESEQCKDWILLFQLDSMRMEEDGFELMWGDCGMLYFYIRKQDLAARNFNNVWMISQCC